MYLGVNKQRSHIPTSRLAQRQRQQEMKIVEIVIDGFKSYAVRTVISGWDESFNSITGLNGSGKSNILDAICFVLGITSMTTVRAQSIQVILRNLADACYNSDTDCGART